MSWTEERVELLRKLWLDGLSASQIAAELAHGITRNAVIGKVHRLGLSGRAKTPATNSGAATAPARPKIAPPPRAAAPPRPIAPMVIGATALAMKPRPTPAPVAAPQAVIVPISERVTIMELREAMCRWPLGDPTNPDFRFCGARTSEAGAPYCVTHAQLAYQPAQDRRRERRAG